MQVSLDRNETLAAQVGPFLQWTEPVWGAVFVFGGRSGRLGDSRQYLKSVEYLDPILLEWKRGPDMTYARVGLAAVYVSNCYYVIGGYNQGSSGQAQKSVEKLDIHTFKWTECAPLLIPRYGHSACESGGKIYVMGGDHSGSLIPFAERYDPDTNVWERLPDMPIRVAASRAIAIEGSIYLFGGCDPSVPGDRASDAILRFDPQTNRWTVLSVRMSIGRTAFSLAPAPGGVCVAGGFDLSTRPETELSLVEQITVLGDAQHPPVSSLPSLPVARAGCQGVTIPLNSFPIFFEKASSMPMIVLGGEYVDSTTGVCRIFDTATMLVNTDFLVSHEHKPPSNGLKSIVQNAFKRRTSSSDVGGALSWSDTVLPPMERKRTAFAACVGPVWPRGFRMNEVAPFEENEYAPRSRERSGWPNLLHDWLRVSHST